MAPFPEAMLEKFVVFGEGTSKTARVVSLVEYELGIRPTKENERALRAVAAIRLGAAPEAVAKVLQWRDFEQFCATLLRARGFQVRENITLTKPRAQVDILARSASVALVIDCKHWAREMGPSGLGRVVSAQAARAKRLRTGLPSLEPMVVVVVSMANERARYVREGAVVPLYALGDFVLNISSYAQDIPRF